MARKSTPEKFKTYNDVFDQFTIRNLFELSSKDYFEDETLSPVSIGKEANVFQAKRGEERVAIKIYRLETSDFTRMYAYIRTDPRFEHLKRRRRDIIFAWCKREYRNLLAAREAGVSVPIPLIFKHNILIMTLIGEPAPMLKDAPPDDPKDFLAQVIDNMKKLHKAGLSHGDLSAFNILNDNERPVLIDFSQAMPLKAVHAEELLLRDAKNIAVHFRKLGVKITQEQIVRKVTK